MNDDVKITRVRKDARYFAASNEPFNDELLSWEARGVMGYLLSKPDDWTVRDVDLIRKGPANEHKIKRILNELKKCGYMRRYRTRNSKGQIVWVTEIYESPSLNPTIGRKSPYGENTKTIGRLSTNGSSTNGKSPYIVSTESSSTEILNTNTHAADAASENLMNLFLSLTNLPLPIKRKDQTFWSKTLQEIEAEFGSAAPDLMRAAVEKLDGVNCTISSPASIPKTMRGLQASDHRKSNGRSKVKLTSDEEAAYRAIEAQRQQPTPTLIGSQRVLS